MDSIKFILVFCTAPSKNYIAIFEGQPYFIFPFIMIRDLFDYHYKKDIHGIQSSKASQGGTFS
jgi:hypothetical protein